ncbi:MAG: hypothetical protein ACLRWP_21155 [Bilophila wadsworthia]
MLFNLTAATAPRRSAGWTPPMHRMGHPRLIGTLVWLAVCDGITVTVDGKSPRFPGLTVGAGTPHGGKL